MTSAAHSPPALQIKHQARPYRLLMPKDIAEELMTAVISAKQEAKVLG